jgi:hypothetical protein
MPCKCELPVESPNPRNSGCVKCGRPIRGPWVVDDVQVERWFELLATVVDPQDARALEAWVKFSTHCILRERWGREHWKLTYLSQDNCAEAKEEAADLAIYPMLEYWKRHRGVDEIPPDTATKLLKAAWHAAQAHALLDSVDHDDDLKALPAPDWWQAHDDMAA